MASKLQTIKIVRPVRGYFLLKRPAFYAEKLPVGTVLVGRRHETLAYANYKATNRFTNGAKFIGNRYSFFVDFKENPYLVTRLKEVKATGIPTFERGGIEIPIDYTKVLGSQESLMNPVSETSMVGINNSTTRSERTMTESKTPAQIEGQRVSIEKAKRKFARAEVINREQRYARDRKLMRTVMSLDAEETERRKVKQRAQTKHVEIIDFIDDTRTQVQAQQEKVEKIILSLRRSLIRAESLNETLATQRDHLAQKLRESKDREKTQRAKVTRLQERVDNLTDPDEKKTDLRGRNLPVLTERGRTVDGRAVVDVG